MKTLLIIAYNICFIGTYYKTKLIRNKGDFNKWQDVSASCMLSMLFPIFWLSLLLLLETKPPKGL